MRVKTWKILDYGEVPVNTRNRIPFTCRCGSEALMPVLGVVLAITGGHDPEYPNADSGMVFDLGPYAIPPVIQCRRCRRIMGF